MIAEIVAATGETINIADAHLDPRCNTSVSINLRIIFIMILPFEYLVYLLQLRILRLLFTIVACLGKDLSN